MELKAGDRVWIKDSSHPWFSRAGELVAREKYGLGWIGWRIKLDEPFGQECYANAAQLMGPARVDSVKITTRRRKNPNA